ncbi:MAG: dTMP kinase [Candidatus Omnitrophota bacterium]
MKGKFITFEGSEGCGKSTQSKLLCEYLQTKGHRVTFLREPGATKISEKIRDILLDAKNDGMSVPCEMLLYMAARAQIVEEIIKPELAKGRIVICDRYLDSTLAYQGYGLGVDVGLIRSVGKFATQGIMPDLTILLDVPVKKGLNYRNGAKDRIEQRSLAYHNRVRRGYFKLVKAEPARIRVVKVDKDKEITQSRIRALIDKYVI